MPCSGPRSSLPPAVTWMPSALPTGWPRRRPVPRCHATPAASAATCAGPAATTAGSSIRGEQPSRRGNKQLKRAFFLSSFAALGDPASRAYYDKKIAQGKHHTQALLCPARRRADVLFAMLRDGTFYEPQPVPAVAPQT
ncbi:hypothetical protein ACIBBB_24375 [Streptomyces sp. NPDC051217]|uniref:hypothetical protein n=1 Tax=Streptomyces sp. NPDC051217 TaxID=3365644 RepID=UPI0037A47639